MSPQGVQAQPAPSHPQRTLPFLHLAPSPSLEPRCSPSAPVPRPTCRPPARRNSCRVLRSLSSAPRQLTALLLSGVRGLLLLDVPFSRLTSQSRNRLMCCESEPGGVRNGKASVGLHQGQLIAYCAQRVRVAVRHRYGCTARWGNPDTDRAQEVQPHSGVKCSECFQSIPPASTYHLRRVRWRVVAGAVRGAGPAAHHAPLGPALNHDREQLAGLVLRPPVILALQQPARASGQMAVGEQGLVLGAAGVQHSAHPSCGGNLDPPLKDSVGVRLGREVLVALLVEEAGPRRVLCAFQGPQDRQSIVTRLATSRAIAATPPRSSWISKASTYCTVSGFVTFLRTVMKASTYAGPDCGSTRDRESPTSRGSQAQPLCQLLRD